MHNTSICRVRSVLQLDIEGLSERLERLTEVARSIDRGSSSIESNKVSSRDHRIAVNTHYYHSCRRNIYRSLLLLVKRERITHLVGQAKVYWSCTGKSPHSLILRRGTT